MSSLKKIYLTGIVSLVIFIFILFLLILPFRDKIRNLSGEYKNIQTELLKIEKREMFLKTQKELFEKAKVDFSEIENAFLTSDDLVKFIASLEKIAKENKTEIEIKSVASPEKTQPYFTFDVSTLSTFPNFLKFLFALENTPEPPYRLIETRSLGIKRIIPQGPEGEKTKVFKVESTFEIRVYTESS